MYHANSNTALPARPSGLAGAGHDRAARIEFHAPTPPARSNWSNWSS
ncbi:hypothetical protein [Nitratidesulfovibrio sp. SRB-5]|nr:hypothetical protein [Nitratidesulfovibrio sp. SRB-5]MBZ2171750.1 hypothetical protein [Nitratidesulfovibrio sp. SRB-5]